MSMKMPRVRRLRWWLSGALLAPIVLGPAAASASPITYTDISLNPSSGITYRRGKSTTDAIFDAIKNGIPGTPMPPAGLPDDSLWKIVAYIRSLRARASDENVEGNLEHGAELFHGTARCSECHMIRGNGGLLGPDLSNIGAERTLRQLREALTTVRPNIPFGFQPVRIRTKSGETVRSWYTLRSNTPSTNSSNTNAAML